MYFQSRSKLGNNFFSFEILFHFEVFEYRAVSRAHSVLCHPCCQVPYVSGISFPSVHMCFVEQFHFLLRVTLPVAMWAPLCLPHWRY